MLCGSHLTHPHRAIRSGEAHTQIRTSSGEWNTAIWAIIALTAAAAASASPEKATRLNARSEIPTGRPGSRACARMNLRSAPAHSGSRSSTGLVCGGMSRTARCWVPVPRRTLPKSPTIQRIMWLPST